MHAGQPKGAVLIIQECRPVGWPVSSSPVDFREALHSHASGSFLIKYALQVAPETAANVTRQHQLCCILQQCCIRCWDRACCE
jgi:hypothetical protein